MQRVTGIFTKQSTRAAGTTYRSGSIFWDKAVKEGNSSRQKSQLSAELSEDATDDVSLHGQRGGGRHCVTNFVSTKHPLEHLHIPESYRYRN